MSCVYWDLGEIGDGGKWLRSTDANDVRSLSLFRSATAARNAGSFDALCFWRCACRLLLVSSVVVGVSLRFWALILESEESEMLRALDESPGFGLGMLRVLCAGPSVNAWWAPFWSLWVLR